MGDSPPGAWTMDEDQYTRSEQRKIDKATRRQQKTMEQGFDTANPLADAALNELAVRGTTLFPPVPAALLALLSGLRVV